MRCRFEFEESGREADARRRRGEGTRPFEDALVFPPCRGRGPMRAGSRVPEATVVEEPESVAQINAGRLSAPNGDRQ